MFVLIAAAHAAPCLERAPLGTELVAEAISNGLSVGPDGGYALGWLSYMRTAAVEHGAPHGAVLFVRTGDGWTAAHAPNGEFTVATARTADAALIVTQHEVEGPGQTYTVIRSTDGFQSETCDELVFPSVLNQPSYATETLVVDRIEIAANGRGRLVASGEIDIETETPTTRWWEYRTSDGGATWSGPKALKGRGKPKGALPGIDGAPSDELIADLRARIGM